MQNLSIPLRVLVHQRWAQQCNARAPAVRLPAANVVSRRVPQHGSGSALHHATARGPMLPHAAAAGPGGAGDEQLREEDSAVYEQLQQEVDAMKHKDIQQALRDKGLSVTGRKQELAERLAKALWDEQQEQAVDSVSDEDRELASLDLESMTTEDLVDTLTELGMDSSGSRSELIQRVSEAINSPPDSVGGGVTLGAGRGGGTDAENDEEARSFEPPLAGGRPATSKPFYPEKEEEVLEEEEEGAGSKRGRKAKSAGPGESLGAALADGTITPSQVLTMTTSQVRKLKVDALRVALRALRAKDTGNRYELTERLVKLVETHQGAAAAATSVQPGASPSSIQEMVSALGLRALRSELARRELDSTGSRQALESRLAAALASEAGPSKVSGPEDGYLEHLGGKGLGALGVPGQEGSFEVFAPEVRSIQEDPDIVASVLFGAPGGTLSDLEAAADAARCMSDSLTTAWPYDAGGSSGTDGRSAETENVRPTGVRARLLYVTAVAGGAEGGSSASQPQQGGCGGLVVVDLGQGGLSGVGAAELMSGVALAGATVYSTPQELSTALGGSSALLSTINPQALAPPAAAALSHLLAGVQVPVLGWAADAGAATNKLTLRHTLSDLGFPVLPTHTLTHADTTPEGPTSTWLSGFELWADKQGWHRERQLFVVKPALGSGGRGVTPVCGVEAAGKVAAELVRAEAERVGAQGEEEEGKGGRGRRAKSAAPAAAAGAAQGAAVLIEPFIQAPAVHYTVTVIEGPDGPLAFTPTEIEVVDIEEQIYKSELELRQRQLSMEGVDPAQVEEAVSQAEAAAAAADAGSAVWSHRGYQPFTRTLHYHTPPRLPAKLIHAVRHAAALAFTRLGLQGAARMDGWVVLRPGWQDAYEYVEDGLGRLLPDEDPAIMEKVKQAVEAEDAKFGPPLSDYYDHSRTFTYAVDLSKFNPKARLHASSNGQADVVITDVNLGLELDPRAPAFLQAAELGLSHQALLRNLVNAALRRSHTSPSAPGDATQQQPPAEPAAATATDKAGKKRGRSATPAAAATAAATAGATAAATASGTSETVSPEAYAELEAAVLAAAEERGREGVWEATGELAPPPDVDPTKLALAIPWAPDRLSLAADMTRWRYEQWAREEQKFAEAQDRAVEALDMAEALNGLLAEASGAVTPTATAPAFAHAEDWDPTFSAQGPATQAALEEGWDGPAPGDRPAPPPEDEAGLGQEELQQLYPLLPVEDLMYVKLGHGEDGRPIDTQKLQAMLQERLAAGEEELAVGVLEQCLVGEPGEEDYYVDDSIPGRMPGGGYQPSPAALAAVMREENRYVNRCAQKVWLLLGGDPEAAPSFLASGLDIMLRLGQCEDLQVEAFLMANGGSGRNEGAVRTQLLQRRVEWMSSGFTDEDVPEPMALDNLRNMPPLEGTPQQETVWALTPATLLRHSAEAVNAEAEWQLHLATTASHALTPLELQGRGVQLDIQKELAIGGLGGVAGLWGGDPDTWPLAPRCLALADFAAEAAEAGALVVPLLRGDLGTTGLVQQVLSDAGVAYTGPAPATAALVGDKIGVAQEIDEIEEQGVCAPPREVLMTSMLIAIASEADMVSALLDELKENLLDVKPGEEGFDEASLALKPTEGSGGMGVARIRTARDLAIYCQALALEAPHIPANALSTAPHGRIPMPRFPPSCFMAEPWVEGDAVTVTAPSQPGEPPAVTVTAGAGWVEVTIGMVGGLGAMEPLGLSVAAAVGTVETDAETDGQTQSNEAGQRGSNEAQAVPRVWLTPAPEDILAPEIVSAALQRARAVVDKLGLQGLVRIDAFVARDTGELMITECDATPDLTLSSPLYRQAQLSSTHGHMGPTQLLRALLKTGFEADRDLDSRVEAPADAGLMVLGEEEEAALAGVEDEESGDVEGAGVLDALASMQGASGRGGGEDDAFDFRGLDPSRGGSDEAGLYLSSTGRPQRRGRPRAGPAGRTLVGDADVDIDRRGRGPEPSGDTGVDEYGDAWGIRGADTLR